MEILLEAVFKGIPTRHPCFQKKDFLYIFINKKKIKKYQLKKKAA
jgi:hypothetical protein